MYVYYVATKQNDQKAKTMEIKVSTQEDEETEIIISKSDLTTWLKIALTDDHLSIGALHRVQILLSLSVTLMTPP